MEILFDSLLEDIEDITESLEDVSDNQQIQEGNPPFGNELNIDTEDMKILEEFGKDADETSESAQISFGKGWCTPSICGGGSSGSWCMPRTNI